MKNSKAKQRKKDSRRFAGIPHVVMESDDYVSLPHTAIRLLLELAKQYNGYNNGDLTAAWSLMTKRGFKSKTTLQTCQKALIDRNLIVQTRQGGLGHQGKCCSLFAVTWQNVDECPGKRLDIRPTTTPLRKFSLEN